MQRNCNSCWFDSLRMFYANKSKRGNAVLLILLTCDSTIFFLRGNLAYFFNKT